MSRSSVLNRKASSRFFALARPPPTLHHSLLPSSRDARNNLSPVVSPRSSIGRDTRRTSRGITTICQGQARLRNVTDQQCFVVVVRILGWQGTNRFCQVRYALVDWQGASSFGNQTNTKCRRAVGSRNGARICSSQYAKIVL